MCSVTTKYGDAAAAAMQDRIACRAGVAFQRLHIGCGLITNQQIGFSVKPFFSCFPTSSTIRTVKVCTRFNSRRSRGRLTLGTCPRGRLTLSNGDRGTLTETFQTYRGDAVAVLQMMEKSWPGRWTIREAGRSGQGAAL